MPKSTGNHQRSSDKNVPEKPSKCKRRVQEVQVQFEAQLSKMKEHLTGECAKRSSQQDAKINSLLRQLSANQSQVKDLEKAGKLRIKAIEELASFAQQINRKIEHLSGNVGVSLGNDLPQGLGESSFMAVTPRTARETSDVVMQQISPFTTSANGETSAEVLVIEVEGGISNDRLFIGEDQLDNGRHDETQTAADTLAHGSGSMERIKSWMDNVQNEPVVVEDMANRNGHRFSMDEMLEVVEDPLALADYHRSVSDTEEDRLEANHDRRPLEEANGGDKKRNNQKAESKTKQSKAASRKKPNAETDTAGVAVKPNQGSFSHCFKCGRTARQVCDRPTCKRPICTQHRNSRRICSFHNASLDACYQFVNGERVLIKKPNVFYVNSKNQKILARPSQEFPHDPTKWDKAPEQGCCTTCRLTGIKKTARKRCSGCFHFYCHDHHKIQLECKEHENDLPEILTNTQIQSSLHDDASDDEPIRMSPKPRKLPAKTPARKRRPIPASSSSNGNTPAKVPKSSKPTATSGYRHTVPLPAELQNHPEFLTRLTSYPI